jgi:hypothetical protein
MACPSTGCVTGRAFRDTRAPRRRCAQPPAVVVPLGFALRDRWRTLARAVSERPANRKSEPQTRAQEVTCGRGLFNGCCCVARDSCPRVQGCCRGRRPANGWGLRTSSALEPVHGTAAEPGRRVAPGRSFASSTRPSPAMPRGILGTKRIVEGGGCPDDVGAGSRCRRRTPAAAASAAPSRERITP